MVDLAQYRQTVIDPVDGGIVMQGSGGNPHGRGRLNGDHVVTIASQPRSVAAAARAYVEHGGRTPGQQIPHPVVDGFRIYRFISRHDRFRIDVVPSDRICHSTGIPLVVVPVVRISCSTRSG